MIWNLVWIIGLLTFGLGLFLFIKEGDFEFGILKELFVAGIFLSIVTFVILLILTSIIGAFSNKTYIKTYENEIYNKDNYSLIIENDNNKFKVYTEDNKSKYIETRQSDSTITEDGNSFIEEYTEYYTNGTVKWLLGEKTDSNKKYNIHIPKGSITTENKVDLE